MTREGGGDEGEEEEGEGEGGVAVEDEALVEERSKDEADLDKDRDEVESRRDMLEKEVFAEVDDVGEKNELERRIERDGRASVSPSSPRIYIGSPKKETLFHLVLYQFNSIAAQPFFLIGPSIWF